MREQLQASAALLERRRLPEAELLLERAAQHWPQSADVWLLRAQLEQQRGRFAAMLECTTRALAHEAARSDAQLMHVHALMCAGETADAFARLAQLERTFGHDETVQDRIAEAYTRYGKHASAQRRYRAGAASHPNSPPHLFNLAASLQATGEFPEAEALLEKVIALAPHDYEAYGMRAGLRRQTVDRNHIAQLTQRLNEPACTPQGEIHLCFALAKELEDLGEHREAFSYLQRGAARRRQRLTYRVENDVEAMRRIREVYDHRFVSGSRSGHAERGPIFVTGLPRSGTTLVDRILSSHSAVESLGEINDLALAITFLAGGGGKQSLIEAAASLDFAALGRRYCRAARGYGVEHAYFIDKSPLNFLYLGLIYAALPNAKVIHMARHPMDACFGMYKTLFRMGYPFSYEMGDLAQYYAAYDGLMAHWREVLPPGWFMDVSYEALVADPEPMTRHILDFCGLDFEPACLEFHRNPKPVATASSVQVRRPINRDAVGRWRRYEAELEPLKQKLIAAGVHIE